MRSIALCCSRRRALVGCAAALALVIGLGACGSSGSSSATTGGTTAARFQARLSLAKCFRAHGVNIPDPTTTGPGGGFGIGRAFRSIDRNSPAFQAAIKACASPRPRFGRGGGAGGGGAGGPNA